MMRMKKRRMRARLSSLMGFLCCASLGEFVGGATAGATPPAEVTFTGSPRSPISSNVAIPAGRASLWISGTVPAAADTTASEGTPARYGDTHTQALSILGNIEGQLRTEGLGLRDVVYLRVYVVPDPAKGGKPDFAGWFQAYSERFGTAENPTKTARSTVAVSALVNSGWLIEIEAFAVYP